MKDSKIEWVGDIPAEWKAIKVKYILSANDGGVWGNEPEDTEADKIVLRSTEQTIDGKWCIENPAKRNLKGIALQKYVIKPNDLLMTKSSGSGLHIGKTTLANNYFLDKECYYSNFIQRLRGKRDKIIPQYLWYIFNSIFVREQFVYLQNSTSGIGNINSDNINDVIMPLPPLSEQKAIAEFLDKKCGEVDALIADIQQEIETLEQYKRSVITEAVTKGLDPSVPMKDSGIQWIGNMPANWECIRGKYILKYLQKPLKKDDGVITCFRDGEVTLRSNRREDGFTMADKEIGYQGVDIGDLVVHGMDGFAGAIGISDSRGKASPVLNVLGTKQNKRYIMYYLRSMAYSDVFIALSTGIRVRSCDLRWNKLAELWYPIPPLKEQEKIVMYIDETIQKANEIIADKQSQIETLESYKKSLIYEYVTGKKKLSYNKGGRKMRIHTNLFWAFYLQDEEVRLDSDKCGKWMYFFNDKTFAASICQKAVKGGVVQEAKHSNAERGVACFYIEYDDVQAHKRVLQFMLENNLIQKTKAGKLFNISFKLDDQTRAGEYGADFKSEIKLADFIDLYTGEWKNV